MACKCALFIFHSCWQANAIGGFALICAQPNKATNPPAATLLFLMLP
ncbi:MAG: hypothetical protein QW377_02460 [Candidatus Pacearchaeota archaeon]